MRVATVFTGVATAAAFAVPANAQTAATLRPALGAARDIRSGDCHSSPHFFTIYGHLDGYVFPEYWCFGGMGGKAVVDKAYSYCGGNNVGYINGTTESGKRLTDRRFHQSSNFYAFKAEFGFPSSYLNISKVYISAWTGSQSCGG
jgi:hypothetical protein